MYNILKETLLETGHILNNEYLEKYLKLILDNLHTEYVKAKTQKHHVLPQSLFRLLSEDLQKEISIKDSLIILIYKDHILAHFYLMKCAATKAFRDKMACAVRWVLRRYKFICQSTQNLDEFSLVNCLDEIQDYYEEAKSINCLKPDTPRKISESLKGKICISKDDKSFKYIHPDQFDEFENQGYHRSHNLQTDESKQKISKAHSGRIVLNNGQEQHNVLPDQLDEYLRRGYVYGQLKKHPGAIAGKISMVKDNKKCFVYPEEVPLFEAQGYKKGSYDNPRKGQPGPKRTSDQLKNYGKNKNRITITAPDGESYKIVREEELQSYLDSGYSLGRPKREKSSKKHFWYNNGVEEHFASEDLVQDLISKGFLPGRLKRNKE